MCFAVGVFEFFELFSQIRNLIQQFRLILVRKRHAYLNISDFCIIDKSCQSCNHLVQILFIEFVEFLPMLFALLSACTLTAGESFHLLVMTLHHLHTSNLVGVLSGLDLFVRLFELNFCKASPMSLFESLQCPCVPGILTLQFFVLCLLDGDTVSAHLGNIHLDFRLFTSLLLRIFHGFVVCSLLFLGSLFLCPLRSFFLLNKFIPKLLLDGNTLGTNASISNWSIFALYSSCVIVSEF